MITADRAKNAGREEGAAKRFGHDDAPEQESPARGQINQARQKTVPIVAQTFADEESQRGRGHNGGGHGQARGRRLDPANLVGKNDQPIKQRRLLQAGHAVVRGHEPLLRLHHLPGCARVLSVGLVVEIAVTRGQAMQQSRQRDQENEESVAGWRRRQRRRIH